MHSFPFSNSSGHNARQRMQPYSLASIVIARSMLVQVWLVTVMSNTVHECEIIIPSLPLWFHSLAIAAAIVFTELKKKTGALRYSENMKLKREGRSVALDGDIRRFAGPLCSEVPGWQCCTPPSPPGSLQTPPAQHQAEERRGACVKYVYLGAGFMLASTTITVLQQ